MSNYPDDYRTWNDNDSRSPFYESKTYTCTECGGVRDGEEMADDDICVYCIADI